MDNNKVLILKVLCFICIAIIVLILIHSWYHIEFLTSTQISEFFQLDPDGYFAQMTTYDIHARGSKTLNELIKQSQDSAQNFSLYEKLKLLFATRLADVFFKRIGTSIPHVNCRQIANIPWRLAKTKWNQYEGGYPHTRQDIIFITDKTLTSPNLVRTLVHEKVHIWERIHPKQMQKWIQANNWKPHSSRYQYPMARSNPDLDSTVYRDPRGKIAIVEYTTKTPSSIIDAKYPSRDNPVSEHPNETLAYYMDYLYSVSN